MSEIHKEDLIKESIFKAALSLFQKYGLKKTTMEDIAKAAGKGKSTLYYYFKSKEEIFEELMAQEMDAVLSKAREAAKYAVSASDKILAYMGTSFKETKKRAMVYNIIIGEIRENDQIVKSFRARYDKMEINTIKDIISFGVKTGEFIFYNDNDIDLLSYSLIVGQRGLQTDMFVEEGLLNTLDRLHLVVNVLIKGLKKP
jgi:AcrR family transcriptional regulator